jgi:predicted nucleic acid-binding protein
MRLYDCCLTLITVYELYWGAEYVQRLQDMEELLKPFRLLDLDRDIVKISARESVRLTKMGQRLDVMDILTAGTCLKLDIPILTGNKDHFARIPHLKVLTPAEMVGEER